MVHLVHLHLDQMHHSQNPLGTIQHHIPVHTDHPHLAQKTVQQKLSDQIIVILNNYTYLIKVITFISLSEFWG